MMLTMLHLSYSQSTDDDDMDIEGDLGDVDPIVQPILSDNGLDHEQAADDDHTLSHHELAEIERKGASHMVEIVVIAMLSMNVLFMLYCYFAERARAFKKRKYHVVSD